MKKILLLAIAFTFGTWNLQAQNKRTLKAVAMPHQTPHFVSTAKTTNVVDTLWLMHVLQNPTMWLSGSGYVSGHNEWGDLHKAQQFTNSSPTMSLNVTGAAYWFGAKKATSGNAGSFVYAWVADTTGTGKTRTLGANAMAPGNFLATTRILISQIDTSGNLMFVTFDSLYNVAPGKDFFVGLGLDSTVAGDTVGLVMSDSNSVPQIDRSWEKWNDGTGWYTLADTSTWELNVDMAIFPIVDYLSPTTGLTSVPTLNGIGFLPYPNPASEIVNVRYEVPAAGKVKFEIYNANGQVLKSFDLGQRGEGVHSAQLNVSELSAGTYFLGINWNGSKIFQKLQIR